MQLLVHTAASKYLSRAQHRWSMGERLILANELNGVVEQATGNIRFTGVLGKPEYVLFNQGKLWALNTPDVSYVGESATRAVLSRIYWLKHDNAKRYGGIRDV